jgi:nucleoid-associated protein YgaU
MKFLMLILLLAAMVSCSGSKKTSDVEESDVGIELSDSEEFTSEDAADDVMAENSEELNLDEESMDSAVTADSGQPVIEEMGGVAEYTVAKNETLMMISFKIYGDYSMWRKISALNGGVTQAREGTVLKYEKPVEMFSWAPDGNKYLIKVGDTLGVISSTTYGTVKFWKDIWNNNKPLIKDPNRIYAGFTIFTPIIEGREVANDELNEL